MLKDLFRKKNNYATIRKINIDSHVKPNIPSGMWTKCDKCHLKNLIKNKKIKIL